MDSNKIMPINRGFPAEVDKDITDLFNKLTPILNEKDWEIVAVVECSMAIAKMALTSKNVDLKGYLKERGWI